MTMKMTKKILSALAAAALIVTAVPAVTVQAAPNAIATYDFENGTSGMSDSGLGGPAPTVVQDSERGNVLQFNGGTGSRYLAGSVDAASENSTKIDPGTPSSLKLDTNPYAGSGATTATISMWVKVPSAAAGDGAALVGFISSFRENMEHPAKRTGENPKVDEIISGQYAYGIGTGAWDYPLSTVHMMYFGGFLRNTAWLADETQTLMYAPDTWKFLVVTVGNNTSDNRIYIDGVEVAALAAQQMEENGIGKRFNHGELDATNKSNTEEDTIMDVLTAADTTAYVGYNGSMAAANGVCIDDLTFYDSAVSAADAMTMFQNAKNSDQGGGNNENPSGADNGNNNNAADGGNQTNNTNTSNNNATSTKSPASSAKAATNNQNLPQTGVVSTGVLVACGAAVVAGGAMLFKKKEHDE